MSSDGIDKQLMRTILLLTALLLTTFSYAGDYTMLGGSGSFTVRSGGAGTTLLMTSNASTPSVTYLGVPVTYLGQTVTYLGD